MFIVYNHIDDLKSPSKKWQVQSYQNIRRNQARINLPKLDGAGRARKPRSFKWQRIDLARATPSVGDTTETDQQIENIETADALLVPAESPLKSALQALRRDPFDVFPIRASRQVEVAVDYCEESRAYFEQTLTDP
jgi:hypothetical protein